MHHLQGDGDVVHIVLPVRNTTTIPRERFSTTHKLAPFVATVPPIHQARRLIFIATLTVTDKEGVTLATDRLPLRISKYVVLDLTRTHYQGRDHRGPVVEATIGTHARFAGTNGKTQPARRIILQTCRGVATTVDCFKREVLVWIREN
jgi:transposase InsO family protein